MSHIGLNGLDPVALLGHFKQVLGKPKYRTRHRGKIYVFESRPNLETFQLQPERFCPQLDGLCPLSYLFSQKPMLGSADYPVRVDNQLFLCSRSSYVRLCSWFPWLVRRAITRYEHIRIGTLDEAA